MRQDEKLQMQGGKKSPNQQTRNLDLEPQRKKSSQNFHYEQIHYELRELEMPAQSEWDFSHLFINIAVFETTNKANCKMLPSFVLATAKSVQ